MNVIKEDAFRKQIKKGLSGGYLFFGDEDYMKSFDLRAAREAVCPDETFAIFNDVSIDALDYSPSALLDALIPPPMMTEQKIVTVSGLSIANMRANEIGELCEALGELPKYDYNVLIISIPAGEIDVGNLAKKPSDVFTRLTEFLTPVHFESVTGARLVAWVGKHFEHNGVTASPEVCAELINYSGHSMFALSQETEKLAFYVLWNGRTSVTSEDVRNVAIAEMSLESFALANAIADGKNEDAMKALSVMKFRRAEPIDVLSEVSRTICDLFEIKALKDQGLPFAEIVSAFNANKKNKASEYKIKLYAGKAAGKSDEKLRRAVLLCSEADLSLKSYSQGYEAIERLICSL